MCTLLNDINLLFVDNNMEQYANASPNKCIHIIDRDLRTTLYEVDEDTFTSFNYADDNIICVGSVLTFFSLKKKYLVFLRTRETVNNSRTYFALVGICQGHSRIQIPIPLERRTYTQGRIENEALNLHVKHRFLE